MESTIYASIDLHYKTSTLGMMAGDGRFLARKSFTTSDKNLVKHVRAIPGEKRMLIIEQGNQAHWAACLLAPYVDKLVICDPKANRSIYDGLVKNDAVDTEKLCELFRVGAIKPVYYASELGKRKLFFAQVKEYERIKKQITITKNQFQASLRNWGYPIKMTKTLYNHPREVLNQIDREDLTEEFSRKLSHIGFLEQLKKQQKQAFVATGDSCWEVAEFQKMPGCGEILSHTISAYLQTPHRFENRGQVIHFSKLAITRHTSDGRRTKHEKLAKTGHSSLKAATYQIWKAALSRQDDNEVKQFYHHSLERTDNQVNARLNTQRKIITSLWSLWKNNQTYRADKFLGSSPGKGVSDL
ncbi:MAG: IS110 family transposase [Balneolaceae bacterium]|nr:MAG: IS110 family transposase [Balneolaceae bacterium]